MNFTRIKFAIEDGLAIITLNRPEAGNAIDGQGTVELREAALRCTTDSSVRAVLLQSEGPNFCFGGDLDFIIGSENRCWGVISTLVDFQLAIVRLATMNAPLVVAVRGAAVGAGLSLAAVGDYVFSSEGAKFSFAFGAVGLSGDGGISWTLPRLIGMRNFKTLALTNKRLTASEAKEMGIVSEVVADEALNAAAMAFARGLAIGPTLAFGAIKRLANNSFSNDLAAQLEAETQMMTQLAQTNDVANGINALFAKQPVRFEGR